jgi:hypothetical protein
VKKLIAIVILTLTMLSVPTLVNADGAPCPASCKPMPPLSL